MDNPDRLAAGSSGCKLRDVRDIADAPAGAECIFRPPDIGADQPSRGRRAGAWGGFEAIGRANSALAPRMSDPVRDTGRMMNGMHEGMGQDDINANTNTNKHTNATVRAGEVARHGARDGKENGWETARGAEEGIEKGSAPERQRMTPLGGGKTGGRTAARPERKRDWLDEGRRFEPVRVTAGSREAEVALGQRLRGTRPGASDRLSWRAQFGEAVLQCEDGRVVLRGGSMADRLEALEWLALFLPDTVARLER